MTRVVQAIGVIGIAACDAALALLVTAALVAASEEAPPAKIDRAAEAKSRAGVQVCVGERCAVLPAGTSLEDANAKARAMIEEETVAPAAPTFNGVVVHLSENECVLVVEGSKTLYPVDCPAETPR